MRKPSLVAGLELAQVVEREPAVVGMGDVDDVHADERVADLVAEHLLHRVVRADDACPTGRRASCRCRRRRTRAGTPPAPGAAPPPTACVRRCRGGSRPSPRRSGSSNRFVNVTSNQRHDPSWWRRRVSTRADAALVRRLVVELARSAATSSSSMIVFMQHADRLVRAVAEHRLERRARVARRCRRARRRG